MRWLGPDMPSLMRTYCQQMGTGHAVFKRSIHGESVISINISESGL